MRSSKVVSAVCAAQCSSSATAGLEQRRGDETTGVEVEEVEVRSKERYCKYGGSYLDVAAAAAAPVAGQGKRSATWTRDSTSKRMACVFV